MNDERIVRRPSLGCIDPVDCTWIERIGAEAIDGLGGERDNAAAAKHLRRACDDRGIGCEGIDSLQPLSFRNYKECSRVGRDSSPSCSLERSTPSDAISFDGRRVSRLASRLVISAALISSPPRRSAAPSRADRPRPHGRRCPSRRSSPDRREIAFVSGGDIWTVPAAGGEARLLVSHPAYDSRPLYSPDGTRARVHVDAHRATATSTCSRSRPGSCERVTFDDVAEQLDAWSRDGKWLYFSSGSKDVNGMNDIFRVSADGGTPMAVSADRFTQEYWARRRRPIPTRIAFTGTGRTRSDWWRQGPQPHRREPDLARAHRRRRRRATRRSRRTTPRDAWPMWSADGEVAVLRVRQERRARTSGPAVAGGDAATAVTSFTNGRVVWPTISYDGKTIVFERDFGIWSLDVASGKAARGADHAARRQRVAGRRASDAHARASSRSRCRPTERRSRSSRTATCSPRRRAMAATPTRITTTPELEAQLAWAPDSRRLAYVSSRDGRDARVRLRLRRAHRDEAHRRRAERRRARRGRPTASRSRSMRGAQGAARHRRRDEAGPHARDRRARPAAVPPRPRRSPGRPTATGSRISAAARAHSRILIVVPLDGGARERPVAFLPNAIRRHRSRGVPDGTYLLFDTSQRTEEARSRARRSRAAHAALPRRSVPRSLPAADAPRHADGAGAAARARRSATARPLRADSARAAARRRDARSSSTTFAAAISLLPVGVDARSSSISPDGKTALLNASAAGQANLYTLLARRAVDAARGRAPAHVDAGLQEQRAVHRRQQRGLLPRERPHQRRSTSSRGRRASINVTAELDVDFAREKLAVFHQAWSILADNFFDAKMNGVDWKASSDQYEPYAAGAQSTEELRRIMRLMVGELNASHSGVNGPSFSPQPNVGRLGVRFDRAEYEQRRQAARHRGRSRSSPAALAGDQAGRLHPVASTARASTRTTNLDSLLLYKTNRRVDALGRAAATTAAARERRDPAGQRSRPSAGSSIAIGSRAGAPTSRRSATADSATCTCRTWAPARSTQLYLDLDTENRGKRGRRRSTSATTTAAS